MITALLGVIGSGKDFQANQLVFLGAAKIDFKDALLDMASDLVGFDVRLDYGWFKKSLLGVRRPDNSFQEEHVRAMCNEIVERNPDAMTGRMLLQRLGTDVMRKRDADYWADEWQRRAAAKLVEVESVVVADCRFLNEVRAIRELAKPFELNHEFVFCDYHSDQYDPNQAHESEKLAQALLKLGLHDGDKITPEHFRAAGEMMA